MVDSFKVFVVGVPTNCNDDGQPTYMCLYT